MGVDGELQLVETGTLQKRADFASESLLFGGIFKLEVHSRSGGYYYGSGVGVSIGQGVVIKRRQLSIQDCYHYAIVV